MPAPSADVVLPAVSSWPLMTIDPWSATSAPEMILIRVDLPAPFSPTIAWTSPGWSSRSTPRSARTPPYLFWTSRRTRTGVPLGERAALPCSYVVVIGPPCWEVARPPGHRGGSSPPPAPGAGRSVLELVDVGLGDPQGGAEQEHLLVRDVRRSRHLGLQGRVGRQRLAVGELLARP